jgi:hypothetical protein
MSIYHLRRPQPIDIHLATSRTIRCAGRLRPT